MATRVLIINKQLVFAVTIKQALEQTGVFDVHPFTAVDTAVDYLQEHPQDVALVDFTLPGTNSATLVERLRAVQPDIAIIASPRPADVTSVMRSLRLQGMINIPFSVRDVIPLIEQAVEDMQGGFFGDVDQTTQPDAMDALPAAFSSEVEPTFGKTRILDDEPAEPPQGPAFGKTRILDDEPAEPPASPTFRKTRILDDEPADLPQQPQASERSYGETRTFEDEVGDRTPDIPPQTRLFGDDYGASEVPGETPLYGRPGTVPEISNLESVLANLVDSSLFEPVVSDEDTPAVPTKDSEALRQFLATTNQGGDAGFDDVLEAIEPDNPTPSAPRDAFSDLVDSMRSSQPQTNLPDRQQQFMDFILTSGMDDVLQEIEKVKTGTLRRLDEPPTKEDSTRTFQRLAKEEPPMPTLEESGTIGDLMIGVSDKSFRNVLAVLRGEEEVEESEVSRPRTLSQQEMEEAFAAFYDPVKGVEPLPEVEPTARPARLPSPEPRDEYLFHEPDIEDEPGDSTLAQIILETALDESTPRGNSLNEVMTNIESRLSVYRPDIQPLPSWGPAFERRKREEERLIREPDFLPEELPPPLELSAELPELEHTDRFNIETTKPSSRQVIEPYPEDIDTDQYERISMSSQVAEDTPTSRPEWTEAERQDSDDFTPLPADYAQHEIIDFEAEAIRQAELEAASPDEWQEEATPEVWSEEPEVEAWPEEPAAEGRSLESAAEVWEEQGPAEEQWSAGSLWSEAAQEAQPAAEVWQEEPVSAEEQQPIEEAWEEPAPAEEQWSAESLWPETVEEPAAPDIQPLWEEAPVASTSLVSEDEARVAQLALNLTQASLELTAEATLLTHADEMIASAGHLASEDIEELSSIIAHDWEAYPEGARIRFVTLVSSGKDYMLYSLKTDEGFTLSLIFAGTTPLRVIRRQGQRLAAALQAVPDVPVEETSTQVEAPSEPDVMEEESSVHVEIQKPVDVGVLTAYAFVWVLRDADMQLSESSAQAIQAGLSIQLAEQRWRIKNLQVAEDHIYLLADVPGEKPAQQIMRELRQRSAEIAHAQDDYINPPTLWADSYFVLTPGRELDMDEIMGFINFERMT